jgi:general L-amino acid transport system permease protein
MSVVSGGDAPPKVAFFNDPKVRSIAVQSALVLVVAYFAWSIFNNTVANLREANIASGFGFLESTAGFDLSFTLIPYSESSTYGRAVVVGILNTMLVAVCGIILATIIGFIVGVMRLSKNWLVSKVAEVYIEVMRNIPLLIQIFIWYKVVLAALPHPRNATIGGRDGVPVQPWHHHPEIHLGRWSVADRRCGPGCHCRHLDAAALGPRPSGSDR